MVRSATAEETRVRGLLGCCVAGMLGFLVSAGDGFFHHKEHKESQSRTKANRSPGMQDESCAPAVSSDQ